MAKKIVACFLGTRPEAIKLAPVIMALRDRPQDAKVLICATGQHRQMLDQILGVFDIRPDADLRVMSHDQTLAGLTSQLFTGIDQVLADWSPDWVVVQGDTTTAMVAALSAFYRQVPVGHIEAGLRTYDPMRPFPEEINRRVISLVTHAHFAPTEGARSALLREGTPAEAVLTTGNTVIDALHSVVTRLGTTVPPSLMDLAERLGDRRVVLVTGHRRESFGQGFASICGALRTIARVREDIEIVYPVHLNPRVRESVNRLLRGLPNVHLLEPLNYVEFVWLMSRSFVILTDSGGVQEEAPGLGKPVLVLRETTERPEGVEAGNAVLVGTNEERIVDMTNRLLDDSDLYARMANVRNPYGDGLASARIADRLVSG